MFVPRDQRQDRRYVIQVAKFDFFALIDLTTISGC
jgi:hypothetical protein